MFVSSLSHGMFIYCQQNFIYRRQGRDNTMKIFRMQMRNLIRYHFILCGVVLSVIGSAQTPPPPMPPQDPNQNNTPQSKATSRFEDKTRISQLASSGLKLRSVFLFIGTAHNQKELTDSLAAFENLLKKPKLYIPANIFYVDEQFLITSHSFIGVNSLNYSNNPSWLDFNAGFLYGDFGGFTFSVRSDISETHRKLLQAIKDYNSTSVRSRMAISRGHDYSKTDEDTNRLLRFKGEPDVKYLMRLGYQYCPDKFHISASTYLKKSLDTIDAPVNRLIQTYIDAQKAFRYTIGTSYTQVEGVGHVSNQEFRFSKFLAENRRSHNGIFLQGNLGVDNISSKMAGRNDSGFFTSGITLLWQDIVSYYTPPDNSQKISDLQKVLNIPVWKIQLGAAYQFRNSAENPQFNIFMRLRDKPNNLDLSLIGGFGVHERGYIGLEIAKSLGSTR